eukprot:TRINITY_DN5480_c0_g6_i1.p1 TRINITY_DN5480_c0_g6~~TRINITY_DN5480_c0_g6_i1.p1  ORF type:complete len:518 (+),score=83.85 TRINITY_DN5480_c0_g6_i1:80-1633(+)
MRFDLFDFVTSISDGQEMYDIKDPAIKLFGKTIPLMEQGETSDHDPMVEGDADEKDAHMETTKELEDPILNNPEESGPGDPDSSSCLKEGKEDNHQDPPHDNRVAADSDLKEDQTETNATTQEKVLKKPDKLIPCPRCHSLDTKFCYYNNYNVNQPRHFCKNCQRYWTAGGTMRNVPVGAGRRKNKHSVSHYRHIMVSSDGIPTTRFDAQDSAHQQVLQCAISPPTRPLKGNGTVLKFGPDAPICESVATVLNLGEPVSNGENREEPSCGSSSVTSSVCLENELPEKVGPMEKEGKVICRNGVAATPPHLQCYGGPPWAYPWNPGWNNVASMAANRCSSEVVYGPEKGNPNPVQWSSPPMVAGPAFCTPTIPFPFVPASYWGCIPNWGGGAWNVPWVGSNGVPSLPSSNSNGGCPGKDSPTLGKHCREANLHGEEKPVKSLWVPKTLRIDDPDEAARSSIWATLGIKHDKNEPITKGGIFKAFQLKTEGKVDTPEAAQVLHANPAAFSRSQTFREST